MYTNLNGKYANAGDAVIFSDGRFNYQQDNMGKALPKEPGTAGLAFVAVRQTDKDICESFFDSRGIERTILSRPDLLAGYFALDSVLGEIKSGGWKSSGIRHVTLVTRSEYLYGALHDGRIFKWQLHEWMVRRNSLIMERPNKDLLEDIVDILNDFHDIGIEVQTQFLEKENYSVPSTLVENPIVLALQASNGNSLMKDNGFEKIYEALDRKDQTAPL